MGYDITKLTTKITTLKSLADELSTQISAAETYIEDAGVNGHYNMAEEIENAIEKAEDTLQLAKDKLKYKLGFSYGPTGPFPTGTYR